MVEITDKRLLELVSSKRYKKSKYKIQLINGDYAVKNTKSGKWVDLRSSSHEWSNHSTYWRDCKGTIAEVLATFNYVEPIIEDVSTAHTLDESDFTNPRKSTHVYTTAKTPSKKLKVPTFLTNIIKYFTGE